MRHLRTVLPKSLHSQLVYFKVLNKAENCVNPHDLQLGCILPTGAEMDFLVAVYEVIFKGLGEESSSFINALIKEAYRMFAPDSPDAKIWQASLDERVSKELVEIGYQSPAKRDPIVFEVVDALFTANRIEAARIAQRYAVPMLEDMTRVVNSDRIRRVYDQAKVGEERLLEKAARALLNAANEFPVIAGVTRIDMDNSRISVIDLQNVLGASSASGVEFSGMMYLYARHLGARNFFLDVDEIKTLAREQYRDYQVRRVREIQQTPKVLTYDEWHNVKTVKGLVGLNVKETRETRKFKVYLNFVTQYITDYPEDILAGMTTVMVVGQQAEAHNLHAHEQLALSETDLEILRNGLDRQGRIWLWFRLKDGMVTAVVDNEVGPIEAWCYTTDDNDGPLRTEMEERIGETEAMKFLAREFPTGSAASYLEQRRRQQGSERQGDKTATVITIVAEELAAKYHEALRKGHLIAA